MRWFFRRFGSWAPRSVLSGIFPGGWRPQDGNGEDSCEEQERGQDQRDRIVLLLEIEELIHSHERCGDQHSCPDL